LGRTGLGVVNLPRLQHAGLEPLVDQPSDHTITDSLGEAFPKLCSRDAVEVLAHVDFHHPVAPLLHHPFAQDLQRLMRIATRPISEGAVQKVLLVDRLEQHRDRTLRH
jgi:hypothetical protein